MKYKKLTKEQIIISIDRLTRFKNTKEKYLRVFSDILVSNLIEPKLKKRDIEKLEYGELLYYVTEIFNNSITFNNNDLFINKILKAYENSIFINDQATDFLLNNNLNYLGALQLVDNSSPVNLKWLKKLIKISQDESYENLLKKLIFMRENEQLKYPIEKIVLVEGITEEILLPAFSKFLDYDFYSKGIQIIAAGGKNQVVKMYYELANQLKVPIFVLLDKDAEDNIKQITPKLRNLDKIHLVSCGEFEDLLPKTLIIKTVNEHFKNFLTIKEEDLITDMPTAKLLEEIFKQKGLHEFKKAEFAKLVRDKISSNADISDEIAEIVKEISLTNKSLDSKICS